MNEFESETTEEESQLTFKTVQIFPNLSVWITFNYSLSLS